MPEMRNDIGRKKRNEEGWNEEGHHNDETWSEENDARFNQYEKRPNENVTSIIKFRFHETSEILLIVKISGQVNTSPCPVFLLKISKHQQSQFIEYVNHLILLGNCGMLAPK